MKNIRRMAGILIGLSIFTGIVHVLNYLYCATDDAKYYLTWRSYYEEEGRITNLYLGSSHVFSDVDPRILDKMTGEYSFDLATAMQRLNGTFYLLREADKGNALKHVYIEMYYLCSTKDNFDGNKDPMDTQYDRNWKNTDYMKMSANKLAYMISIGGIDRYVDILLPFHRYRSQLGNWEYVKENIDDKDQEDYFSYQSEDRHYLTKGFYGSAMVKANERACYRQIRIFDDHPIGEKSDQYLRKIILYCQKNGIPITLFISPVSDLQLISTVNYDNYINELKKIAKEYGILFYDFNLAKEEFLSIQSNDYYADFDHLNATGAELFSSFLGQVIQQTEAENKKYFYTSYAEKLRETPPTVYGIYYRDTEAATGEMIRKIYVASNRDEGMEYRIILTPEDGVPYMVQDFEENKVFAVSTDDRGICTIVARMTDHSNDVVQTIKMHY